MKKLTEFREVFEKRMNQEGFVWHKQTYMHVDFDQGWIIAFWPYSYYNERYFNLQFDMRYLNSEFFDAGIEKMTNALHSYQGLYMFRQFDFPLVDKSMTTNDGTYAKAVSLEISKDRFQQVFDAYCRCASPHIHAIHTPMDAYVFKKKYIFMLKDQLDLHIEGKEVVDYLLYLGKREEALSLIPLMHKRYHYLLEHNQEYLKRLEASKNQDYYQWELQRAPELQKKLADLVAEVDQLEAQIRHGQYAECVVQVGSLLQERAETLKKCFSQKQLAIMATNWNIWQRE